MPCLFLGHGGGPMPLIGRQPDLAAWLSSYAATLPRQPKAIVLFTAHWETHHTVVSGADRHELYYDYGGFPPETYKYKYPAPGSSSLAQRIQGLFAGASLGCSLDMKRGWDHGVFVPLMLMFPEARIPVVQVSVLSSQSAAEHIAVGEALQPLREDDVLIIGSGQSFHNRVHLFNKGKDGGAGIAHAAAWDEWLQRTTTSPDLTDSERRARIAAWETAPSAREAHARGAAEHMMPFFTVFGAGGAGPPGRVVAYPSSSSFRSSQFEFA